jgi:HPt (histidine-containing phosphotransfer) domain-containing protein
VGDKINQTYKGVKESDEASDSEQIFMKGLKQEFIEKVSEYLIDLKRLYKENNLMEVAKIAHDIKGISGIFGFDYGTKIASELNITAKNNEKKKSRELIDKLTTYMKKQNIVT